MFVGGSASAQPVPRRGADAQTGPGARPVNAEVVVLAPSASGMGTVLLGVDPNRAGEARVIAVLPETGGVLRELGGLAAIVSPAGGTLRVFNRDGVQTLFIESESGFGRDGRGPARFSPGLVDAVVDETGMVYSTHALDGRVYWLDPATGTSGVLADLGELSGEPDLVRDPGMMKIVDGRLYVQVRRNEDTLVLERLSSLAVIELATGELVDADPLRDGAQAIELTGPWPRLKMRIEPGTGRLLVSATGPNSHSFKQLGGIEAVNLETLASEGYVAEEVANMSAVIPTGEGVGFVMGHTDIVASSHLARYEGGFTVGPDVAFELFAFMESFAYSPWHGLLFMPTADGRLRVIDEVSERDRWEVALPGRAIDMELMIWR